MIDKFYQHGTASVIIDGQYGSTGKGLIAGYIALQSEIRRGLVIHTTNAAPNAGHTVEWSGRKLVSYHLPTGGLLRGELCYVNAGAVVDVPLLRREIEEASAVLGEPVRMAQVHPMAAMLLPEDVTAETEPDAATTRISGTRKGVGSALARKVRREALTIKDWKVHYGNDEGQPVKVNAIDLNRMLDFGQIVSIEVPQGMSLGLNHGGFYPFVTSREVSVSQALSDAGIHPACIGNVCLTMRTFPIRVGSLPGQTSGGHHFDQREMQWTDFPWLDSPELTTVTKRPRRIFSWSREQYRIALRAARPQFVFLNFVNYFRSVPELMDRLADMDADHQLVNVFPKIIYGMGPSVEHVQTSVDVVTSSLDAMIRHRRAA